MPVLIVLGIDPGSRFTGFAVVERHGARIQPRTYGRIRLDPRSPLPDRLAQLESELLEILGVWRPDRVAIESLFHGINARSLIVLAQTRGAILSLVGRQGLALEEFSPAEVKSAVTGSGRASKEQVARMVGVLLGIQEVAIASDATDALAVALCQLQRAPLQDRVSRITPG